MIPVLLIMLIGGLWSNLIEIGNGEIHATSFVPAILIVGIFVFTITRGLAKQRKMFKSYLLIIKDDVIEREQIMTPTISLTKDMITEIVTVTFAWSIYEVYTNKNIDDKSKRSIWGMAIAILVFIAIAYVKVVG